MRKIFIIPLLFIALNLPNLKAIHEFKPINYVSIRITNYFAKIGIKTACNSKIKKSSYNNWVAISRQMKDSLNLKFNDTIEIVESKEVKGKYIIKDLTNKRIKNTIDLLTCDKRLIGLRFGKMKLI